MLTIWHDGSQHTFTAGHDVVIGRDQSADIRIADPRISREHLILRFEQGKWLAIDNGSVNGTFVNGYRRPVIDIHDGQSINIGNAGGPRLTFAVGQHHRGRPPGGGSQQAAEPPTADWSTPAPPRSHPPGHTGGPQQARPRAATAAPTKTPSRSAAEPAEPPAASGA